MARSLNPIGFLLFSAACGVGSVSGPRSAVSQQGLSSSTSSQSCQSAADCSGMLPDFCRVCADGSNGCAHWDCLSGACQVATCEAAPPPASCQLESDCAQGQSCQGGSCAACRTVCTEMCVLGSSCQADANGCVSCQPNPAPPACQTEADCAQGQSCQGGSCAACPQACTEMCVLGSSCQADANGCVSCQPNPTAPSCQSDWDCPPGQICQAGSCAACPQACSAMCVLGSSCQPDANGCMSCQPTPACQSDWDCPWGQYCIGGSCQ
ncbi:MAG: hypothetical protein ACYCWW_01080 [Deltaproteobacteria bacterium]